MPLLKALAHPDDDLGTQQRNSPIEIIAPGYPEYPSKRRAMPCRKNGQAVAEITDEHWRAQASVGQGQPSGVSVGVLPKNGNKVASKFDNAPDAPA